jgi:hypothetical protein
VIAQGSQAQYPASSQIQDGYYINNLVTLAEYLMANGYSPIAASGIAGTVAGESAGNPESVGSGGAGLIGWTPPSKASPYQPIVTGNPQQDFDAQLADILTYNQQQGSGALTQLNAQTTPLAASDYYSQVFERPKITDSDVRPGVANYVYDRVAGLPVTGALNTPGDVNTTSAPATTSSFEWYNPTTWASGLFDYLERFGLIVFGGALILVGIWMLTNRQAINITMNGKSNASQSQGT